MALVAYGDSDMSDYEDEEETLVIKNKDVDKVEEIEMKENSIEHKPSQSRLNLPAPKSSQDIQLDLFSKLPQPKENISVSTVVEEEDEFLKKKEKPIIKPPPRVPLRKPVKIQLTALSDLQEEDIPEPNMAQYTPAAKPSGLLGILPPPKQIVCANKPKRPMVPHVLTKKPIQVLTPKPKTVPNKKTVTKSLINYESSDESDSDMPTEKSGDKSSSDFFSLNEEYKLPEISYEELNIKPATSKFSSTENNFQENYSETHNMDENNYVESINEADQQNGELQLDDEALRQLCGSRAKRYKSENIQIIDMSHKDILPNEEEWMREALQEATAGPRSHGVKALGGPSSTQKRKHQITYLAHQAKANELELQNQWAANRQTRRQTQSKYGF